MPYSETDEFYGKDPLADPTVTDWQAANLMCMEAIANNDRLSGECGDLRDKNDDLKAELKAAIARAVKAEGQLGRLRGCTILLVTVVEELYEWL